MQVGERAPDVSRRLLGWFRDPAIAFLVVGGCVAVALVFIRPSFEGIDEPAHFARAYQITSGTLVPDENPGAAGGGACLPRDVLLDISAGVNANSVRRAEGNGVEPLDVPAEARVEAVDALPPCGDGARFSEFATFAWYSPVPYLPAAAGIGVARVAGGGTTAMLLFGRLAQAGAYLALGFVAIRRAPRGRWALHVAALAPMALMSVSAVSPDALAAVFALLVVSSALRMADRAVITRREAWREALPLAVLLGLGKPTYWVVAFAYVLPMLAVRRPAGWRPLAAAVVAAPLVSTVWQRGTENRFVCDVGYFGTATAPDRQLRELITAPHHFLTDAVRTLVDDGWAWTRQLVSLYPDVIGPVPSAVAVAALGFLVLLAFQAGGGETPDLGRAQRLLLVGIFVVGVLGVLAGFYVYCSPAGDLATAFTGARHFLPLLPALLVGMGPPYRHRPGLWLTWPLAALELPAAVLLVARFAQELR